MGNIVDFAKEEFERLGWPGKDEMQKMVCDDLLDLLEVFEKQNHSGTSAYYVLNIFDRLAKFKPISPLTGEDDEWQEVGGGRYQNIRRSSVLKDGDGQAFDFAGRVFREPDGTTYTSSKSRVPVEFPYYPPDEPEIVDVDEEGNEINGETDNL